jgi:membrane protein DedA with SNARE-associated domain
MLHWLQSLPPDEEYGALFTVLFLNNLGLPMPGNTLLLAAAFLVGAGRLSFWATVLVATGANFMGTNGSYWLGRRYGRPLIGKIKWLRLTHERARHMDHFFKRYGSKGVFFAWFVALLHPFIGILAALGKTPGRSFLFFNLAGSAAFSFFYVLVASTYGLKWGFLTIWRIHTALYLLVLVVVLMVLSLFLRHDIYTIFGHPFYKRKRKGFF